MEFGSGTCLYFAVVVLIQVWPGSWCQEAPDKYSLQTDSGTFVIEEGLCLTVYCQFTANNRKKFSNSTGYWKADLGTNVASNDKSVSVAKPNFHLTGDPNAGDCTLRITDATEQDSGTYFFRFEESRNSINKFNFMASKITVKVTDLTEKPNINVFGEIIANKEVSLSCFLPGICSEPVMKWWRYNGDVVSEAMNLTLTPSILDHGTSVTCEVTLPKVESSVKQTLILNVQYPPTISISTTDESSGMDLQGHTVVVMEGDSLSLRCSVDCNPEAEVIWAKGERNVASSVTGQGLVLFLTHVKPIDADTYSCTATNSHGDTSDFVIIEVEPSKVAPSTNLYTDLEEVTAASSQQASWDMNYILLAAIIAGNVLVLSLIALLLFCFVRRNMKRRQQGISNNGQELSSQGSTSAYKGFND